MPQPKLTLTDTVSIVLIGPESTGKTTLAQQLAAHFGAPFFPEYARTYLEQKATPGYTWRDLEAIAKKQTAERQLAKATTKGLLFFDTDLVTLHIWVLDKFGKAMPFVEENLATNLGQFYLLCAPDLPWQPDPLREDATRRDELFAWNETLLHALNARYAIVRGHQADRLANAERAIHQFLVETT